MFYTLAGGIAILSLWALIIYPERVSGLEGDQKQFFNLMMSAGFYLCGMYYLFLVVQICFGFMYGYPSKEELAYFKVFALFCLGPLLVVSRRYYQWSLRKCFLVGLGTTALVLSVILIGVNALRFLELPKF